MSRNGSGTYTLPAGNPVVTGTTISSTWANNTLTDIATALTGSLAADGQTTATGNLKMGSNRITGLADGIASTDAATIGQLPAIPAYGTMATQNANNVAITGGSITGATLNATDLSSGTVGYARLPVGSVLQVVQTTNTTQASTTSTSLVTTGVSATITPKFSTSKILALVVCGEIYAQSQANYFTLYRGATNLASTGYMGGLYCNTANVLTGISFNVLDNPATTSATTYTIYYRASSGTAYLNFGNAGLTTIILMEIAG
jgi:hypothetical protein